MFRRAPTRSTIGIRRARPGSSVRTYRPKRSTVHSYPCGTDLTANPTKITANMTMRITKMLKELSMALFQDDFDEWKIDRRALKHRGRLRLNRNPAPKRSPTFSQPASDLWTAVYFFSNV